MTYTEPIRLEPGDELRCRQAKRNRCFQCITGVRSNHSAGRAVDLGGRWGTAPQVQHSRHGARADPNGFTDPAFVLAAWADDVFHAEGDVSGIALTSYVQMVEYGSGMQTSLQPGDEEIALRCRRSGLSPSPHTANGPRSCCCPLQGQIGRSPDGESGSGDDHLVVLGGRWPIRRRGPAMLATWCPRSCVSQHLVAAGG